MSTANLDYYERHAQAYALATLGVDMQPLIERFLAHVPKGGHILDVGCGSGRDARTFLDSGYAVTALEGSRALAQLATQHLGQPVRHQTFIDIDWQDHFDGVWACASLLHCQTHELPLVLQKIARALKSGGVFYLSFKKGSGYRKEGARYFLDLNAQLLRDYLQPLPCLQALEIWYTTDQRPHHSTRWLNALLIKT